MRIAAVKEGDEWNNVVTVIRLSQDEPDVRKEKLLHRIYKLPLKTANLLIIGDVQPFSVWPDILHRYQQGRLPYDRDRYIINWSQVGNLDAIRTSISISSSSVRNLDGRDWPRISVGIGQFYPQKLTRQELYIEAGRFSAPDPHTIIANTVGVTLDSGRPLSSDFFLDAVIPIDVDRTAVLGNRGRLEFRMLNHIGLAEVRVVAEFVTFAESSIGTPISRLELEHSVERRDWDIEERKYSASFRADELGPWLDIRAIHPRLGMILEKRCHTQELFSHAALNPMMAALCRFCQPDDPKALVLNPEVQPRHRTNPSALFELRVNWLLSALGFQSIILGKYEKLVAPATNHEYGSVDIIATHPKSRALFVIGCSLDPAKEHDKDRLINVTAVLMREVFTDVDQPIRPLIITAASKCGTEASPGACNPPVLVIDREGIERLWDAAEAGNSEHHVRWMES